MPIAVLGAFLRLGRKYEIDHIRKAAVQRLAVDYPTELGAFRASWTTEFATFEIHDVTGGHLPIINVIRENDLLVHLPAAFLECIADHHNKAVSVFFPSPESQQPILPYTDIELCVQVHQTFLQYQCSDMFL